MIVIGALATACMILANIVRTRSMAAVAALATAAASITAAAAGEAVLASLFGFAAGLYTSIAIYLHVSRGGRN